MKPFLSAVPFALACSLAAATLGQTPLADAFKTLTDDERTYFQHVTTLSNPFFEGRAPGLRGNVLAAEYVEFNFKKLGLSPAFPVVKTEGEGMETGRTPFASFRQPFSTGKETIAKTQSFSFTAGGQTVDLVANTDFAVRGVSGSGKASGPLVCVGYGIESGKDGYNSFAVLKEGDDLTGKIALLFRFEPLSDKGKSRWSDDGSFSTRKYSLSSKLRATAERKPAAILLVSPPGVDDPLGKTLQDTKSSTQGSTLSIPVINLHVDAATRMLAAAGGGNDLMALRKAADEKGGVTEIPGLSVTLEAAVAREPNSTDNVGAVLAGKGALKDEFIVIGAHFDHVGYGFFGSRSGSVGQLHPGADDNGSGASGLLVLAAKLTADYAKLPESGNVRSIMFVGFSGEEGGLLGSRHFVRNCPLAASKIYAMLNMDMIGRARLDAEGRPKCQVEGVATARGFEELLKPMFDASGVAVKPLPGGQGPSDHASFYKGNIPVLHFFTGLHDQYHTPTDTYDLINPVGAVKVIELVRTIANALAPRTELLEFTPTKGGDIDYTPPTEEAPVKKQAAATAPKPPAPPAEEQSTPRRARPPADPAQPADEPAPSPGRTGSKVRFGIAPGDYSEGGGGVEVGEVFPGTSAADAGLKQGDIITKWNDTPLRGVQDWMPLLMKANPGDKVKLTVKRGSESKVLDCTLKGRDQ